MQRPDTHRHRSLIRRTGEGDGVPHGNPAALFVIQAQLIALSPIGNHGEGPRAQGHLMMLGAGQARGILRRIAKLDHLLPVAAHGFRHMPDDALPGKALHVKEILRQGHPGQGVFIAAHLHRMAQAAHIGLQCVRRKPCPACGIGEGDKRAKVHIRR